MSDVPARMNRDHAASADSWDCPALERSAHRRAAVGERPGRRTGLRKRARRQSPVVAVDARGRAAVAGSRRGAVRGSHRRARLGRSRRALPRLLALAPRSLSAQRGLASLPLAAQGPISQALGAESPAYRVRAARGG